QTLGRGSAAPGGRSRPQRSQRSALAAFSARHHGQAPPSAASRFFRPASATARSTVTRPMPKLEAATTKTIVFVSIASASFPRIPRGAEGAVELDPIRDELPARREERELDLLLRAERDEHVEVIREARTVALLGRGERRLSVLVLLFEEGDVQALLPLER